MRITRDVARAIVSIIAFVDEKANIEMLDDGGGYAVIVVTDGQGVKEVIGIMSSLAPWLEAHL